MSLRAIDLNANVPGCPNIKWHEVLYLVRFAFYVHPDADQNISNMITICQKVQKIRKILGDKPIFFTSGYRPLYYNNLIKGAVNSGHLYCEALDWKHATKSAEECRKILKPHLDTLEIRMENRCGDWVHTDIKPPGITGRYFTP